MSTGVTKSDIMKGLQELGVKTGMSLEVHSSLSSFGHVEGGAPTLIEALMQTVGEQGAIVMPAFLLSDRMPLNETDQRLGLTCKIKILSEGDEQSGMGIVADTFRKMSGVVTGEGIFRVSAWGNDANLHTADGFQHLIDIGGYAILFGVDIYRLSSMHYVEEDLPQEISNIFKTSEEALQIYPEDQWFIEGGKPPVKPWYKIQSEAYQKGFIKEAMIGSCKCMFFKVQNVIELYREALNNDPIGLYGLRKQSSQELFQQMYKTYHQKIYHLALRMCNNHEDAQDIVQDTYIQAYQNYDKFRAESSEYTWLYKIAKNLCLKLLQKRRKSSFTELEELIHNNSSGCPQEYPEIERAFLTNQVKEGCLLSLVRCLSFYQRMAFILHVLSEVSITDTALILDKSVTATRTLVTRAKQNIRAFMCKNCSLYQEDNPCHCENLIEFSLKNQWIHRATNEEIPKERIPLVTADMIEQEIYSLDKLLELYRNLPKPLNACARKLMFSDQKLIFTDKKVK